MATLFGGATPPGSQFLDGSPGIKVGLTLTFLVLERLLNFGGIVVPILVELGL
jgi:hypothetical protein